MQGTIKSKQRIDELFRRGSRLFAAGFMALSLPKEREEGTQELAFTCGSIAFIAGKKLGSAPQRSRAKRRLREAARAAGAPWTGYDVVLVAKAGVFRQDFKELVADLARFGGRFAPVPPPEDFQIYTTSSSCGSTSPAKPRKQLLMEGSSSQLARLAAFPLLLLDDKTEVSSSTGNGLFSALVGIPRNIALLCINIYRHAISPLLPPSCRYVPTCSEYALIAFERFGFCRGLWLSVRRILRCNPLAKGGYDPVPEVRENKLAKYNAS